MNLIELLNQPQKQNGFLSTEGSLVNKTDLLALLLTVTRPVQDALTVLLFDKQIYLCKMYFGIKLKSLANKMTITLSMSLTYLLRLVQ